MTAPRLAPEAAEVVAAQVRGAFVVVVTLDSDRYRRRVMLTLAAAQRLAERARERGHEATVMLARLEPVCEVDA